MRFLKVFLICWFSFYAFYLVLALVLHVTTGYDPTSECAALTAVSGIEAVVSAVIEVCKTNPRKAKQYFKFKRIKKSADAEEGEDYYGDVS